MNPEPLGKHTLEHVLDQLYDQAGSPPPETRQWLRDSHRFSTLGRGELFAVPGKPLERVGWVVSGLLKYAYLREDGRVSIKHFVAEGEWVFGIPSLWRWPFPMPFAIEAVEPVRLLTWPTGELARRLSDDWWRAVFEPLLVKGLIAKEQREADLMTLPAAERYENFLERQPALACRLPLHLVADYLRMTPEHLSRVRARRVADPGIVGS